MHTVLRIFGIQLKVQCRYSHDGYIQFNHSLLCKMQWNWSKFFVSCNTRFYILYYQTGFKSSLFDPWIQKCRRVHQEKSCHWQIHSCYPWRGWWCEALFIITIMWVNHLCLIFEFRNVEEFVRKNLVTDKFTVIIHGEDDGTKLCSLYLAKKFYRLLKTR